MTEEEQALNGELGAAAQSAVLLDKIDRLVLDAVSGINLTGGGDVKVKGSFPSWTVTADPPEQRRKRRKIEKQYALQIIPIPGGSFGAFYFVPGVVNLLGTYVAPTVGGVSVYNNPRPTLLNMSAGCVVYLVFPYTMASTGLVTYDGTCEIERKSLGAAEYEDVYTFDYDWDSGAGNFVNGTQSGSGRQYIRLDYVDRDNIPMNIHLKTTGVTWGSTEAKNQTDPTSPLRGVWSTVNEFGGTASGSADLFYNSTGSRTGPRHYEPNP